MVIGRKLKPDEKLLQSWVVELKKFVSLDPRINSATIRGGAVLDAFLGLEPADIDILYDLKDKNSACICKELDQKIKESGVFEFYDVDIESSGEKEPKTNAVERTCGYYSYQTEYNSMLALCSNGFVSGDSRAWGSIQDLQYKYRPQALSMWFGFPNKSKDLKDPFEFTLALAIRAINYCVRRNLTPDSATKEFLSNLEILCVSKVASPSKQLRSYALKKLNTDYIDKFNSQIFVLPTAVGGWLTKAIEPHDEDPASTSFPA
jgi:hypothetical protein